MLIWMVCVVHFRLMACQQITACVEDVAKIFKMDECKLPAAECGQNRVPVVQFSSAGASSAGLTGPY